MQSFIEYYNDDSQLDEGILRSGSVATFAARSAAAGKKADAAFKRALAELNKPIDHDNIPERLDCIDAVLKAMLEGHLHRQLQAGNHAALDAVGHLTNKTPRSR